MPEALLTPVTAGGIPQPPADKPPRGWRQALQNWNTTGPDQPLWSAFALALAALMLLPVASIILLALSSTNADWPHLIANVLPVTTRSTLLLVAGTAAITLVIGTATAWLVTMYRFPGRTLLDRLLVLPLAIPTYIVAYCYVELLEYGGPVQSAVRSFGGYATARDYWFPDIRSTSGAILILSLVLYPYVYLTARASFVQQSMCVLEVARTLGQSSIGAFWRVALPLARPALAAGAALVMMETLNDLGAVQYLGVETLSVSIYVTWLQRANLAGATQIALLGLIAVAIVLIVERLARGNSKFHHTTGRYRAIPFQDIDGWRGYTAAILCALPVVTGFVIPVAVLGRHALTHSEDAFASGFLTAATNSVVVAAVVAAVAVVIAVGLAYAARIAGRGSVPTAIRLSGMGYALPGTVLAIGVLIPFAAFDNAIDALVRQHLGWSTGLLLSGTLFALVFALTTRFLTVALGNIEAGLQKVSPNLDAAARTLGETPLSALRRVHLPLLLPAMGAAGLLVFVDAMKELPATLLLRPFNFDTLATHVYGLTALEQFERAALGALAIVLAGLVPVLLLHRTVAGSRPGSGSG
ncbi:MAG: iron ABC transporter permease [Hyphomicrobium sp. 32-62-53]|nr:MAG: iron ABC transporter permease [Hyphomicrobium sp. 12-62-95]OYY01824.1 MAG: iron ABC transporter permease [Hyphomicrobium sp. 32-62-53]